MIRIVNDGQAIVSTNYWDSENAGAGYCYLSWNAGAGRVLVPDRMLGSIAEMRTARYVVVSRGPWVAQGGRDAVELLFEDETDSPFFLILLAEQTDRCLPDSDQGGGFVVSVWTRQGEQIKLPGKYRSVAALPCLDPWVEQ